MYEPVADPYCYAGTSVLKNIAGLQSQADLDRFEAVATARRFLDPMPIGRWSLAHYAAIHRHIFQDVYPWGGRFRKVRISKGGSMFCYPEHIPTEMRRVFRDLRLARCLRGRDPASFARGMAHFIAELNAIHAFRDGNGRAQLAFASLLAASVGHPFDLDRLDPAAFLAAMIGSFRGDESDLAETFAALIL